VSLPITYWLCGVLGGLALVFLLAIASAMGNGLLSFALGILAIAHSVFMSVAIWRSAGRYPGKPVWGHLARIAVAAGIARAVVGVLSAAAS
jgi:hypothetical protein